MDIMINHAIVSDNSDEFKYLYQEEFDNDTNINKNVINKNLLKGGANDEQNEDRPNGGFPPIFAIDEVKEKEVEKIKNRQLKSTRTSISIRDILKSKN